MAGGSGSKTKETEAERALAQIASERLNDYKKRWAPLVSRAADLTQSMGKEGSFEREQMAGKTTAATRSAFTQAGEQVDAANANRGISPDSARAKLGTVAAGNTEASSLGIGLTKADQAIDDAYTQGLASLIQMGRGEAASATTNQAAVAQDAARQAQADALQSAQERAGYAQLAGTAIGIGAGQFGRSGGPPSVNMPGGLGYGTIDPTMAGVGPW